MNSQLARSALSGLLAVSLLSAVALCACATMRANPNLPATIAGEAAKIVTSVLPAAQGNAAFEAEIAYLNQQIAAGKPNVVLDVINDPNGPLATSNPALFALIWQGLHTGLPLILDAFGVPAGDLATYYGIEQSVAVAIVQGCAAGLHLPPPVPVTQAAS